MCSISHNTWGEEQGPKPRAGLTIKSTLLITTMVRAIGVILLCNISGPPAHKGKTSFIQREDDRILAVTRGKKKISGDMLPRRRKKHYISSLLMHIDMKWYKMSVRPLTGL